MCVVVVGETTLLEASGEEKEAKEVEKGKREREMR